jgi:FkbM family methyltransferase
MSPLRFQLIRFWTWILRHVSSDQADPADIYFSYRLLLDRPPDEAGWQNYLKFIKAGRDRHVIVDRFLKSSEFQELRAIPSNIQVDTGNFSIWVDSRDSTIARGILQSKSHEPHVTAVLARELKSDATFVDIGANMGWFTLLAASIANQVIAIEPNPNNIQLIYRSLLDNRFQNVRVMQYAVTDVPKLMQLNFIQSNGFVSTVVDKIETSTLVQGMPLDLLLGDVERLDVIKIDIEGHEPVALIGMKNTLERHHPLLLFEYHPMAIRHNTGMDPETFLESLRAFGYDIYVIENNGIENGPLTTASVLNAWDKVNHEMNMGGAMHLDLIGRWS